MFEGQMPLGQTEKPNLRHAVIGALGGGAALILMALTPDPVGPAGTVKHLVMRELIELGPSILLLVAVRLRVSTPGTAAAVAFTLGGAAASQFLGNTLPAIGGALVGAYLFLSVKVAEQWERCVVLRLGRYHALRGPGLFRIVPIVDSIGGVVDGRVRTTEVHAEAALTRDTVPVHVDAVIFWIVWSVEKAVLEVRDFDQAVGLVAQTALLESIGRHHLGDMIAGRAALARDLEAILREKTASWGITVQSVEIRDLRLPAALQDAMSRQAQAERERQARVIFGTTEVELAAKFAEASEAYRHDPTALHLRAMNMLFEAIKENGRMVVVPASSLRRRRL